MNAADLHRHLDAMRAAIGESLRRLRVARRCIHCNASIGEQHARTCAAWPIIAARAAYARQDEEERGAELPLMMP
jgi:hypothetical protein